MYRVPGRLCGKYNHISISRACLLAARISACWDPAILGRYPEWIPALVMDGTSKAHKLACSYTSPCQVCLCGCTQDVGHLASPLLSTAVGTVLVKQCKQEHPDLLKSNYTHN